MQVRIELTASDTPIDDIVSAQIKWYMSCAYLPAGNSRRFHRDPGLKVTSNLILIFPRMVCLGVRDKEVVAILLQARFTDILIDTKHSRILLAWASRSQLIIQSVPHSVT